MKRFALALAVIAALSAFGQRADAGFIIGQQAFISDATTAPPPPNRIGDPIFAMSWSTLSGGTNQTGGFIGEAASFVNILNTTSTGTYVFGNSAFGTFTVGTTNVNLLIPNVSRTVNLSGTFTPGTDFPGGAPTPGDLTITINQAARGVLSASATLATHAVPEPSSIVLLGTFCGPVAVGFLRRRRLGTAPLKA